jgi:hypothetical protein
MRCWRNLPASFRASIPQGTSGSAGAASADGGGHIVNLALLGQYAANFTAGSSGGMITDPTGAASVIEPTKSMTVAHS